jgi:hypothetical protein
MTDLDVRDRFERLMADEPPHRPLPDLVRAGEGRLRRHRLSLATGVAAVAVVGLAAAVVGASGQGQTVRDRTGYADPVGTASSAAPSTVPSPAASDPEMGQTLAPGKKASYSYGIYADCGGAARVCHQYRFESRAVRAPVVAAIEFRLTDGTSMRRATHDGAYDVVMRGTLPAGDLFAPDGRLVDAEGNDTDLFAGLTLFAADGSVLATATATDSTQLDGYLEKCDLLDDPTCTP